MSALSIPTGFGLPELLSRNYFSRTSWEGSEQPPGVKFELKQNNPNPFFPATVIRYSLQEKVNVILKVYDILGNEVSTLVAGVQDAGEYDVVFDAGDMESGVYFYKLCAGSFRSIRKMILIK